METGASNEEFRKQIANLASNFKIFECEECASAIKQFLIEKGIRGKHIKLYTGSEKEPYGNIYHEIIQKNIATNGRHQGIAIEIQGQELVFDNIEYQGVSRKIWMNNLYCVNKDFGGDFEVTELDF
jgi:hypothetical protein